MMKVTHRVAALREALSRVSLSLGALCLLSAEGWAAPAQPAVDTGTTAWMLTSTTLVLLMIPGLAMFYGGLVRTKNDEQHGPAEHGPA